MSLLEDIFLGDEAGEAQQLERVIEGDEYDERPRSLSPSGDESDNEKREDEAEEDKRRVDPTSTKTKRVTKNPRFILNPARLTGPRGIQVIPEHFKDFKFKGKGHEKDDLDMVLKKLEHWAYRLYPKFKFEDCLKKIETLGKKRPVMVHLHKIRTDQFMSEETVVQKDSSDDEAQAPQEEDEFDKLLQQQIDLARATPAPGSVKKVMEKNDQWARVLETPNRDDRSLIMPKATSSPSISDEQKERMIRNRKLAEERRLARLKQATSMDNNSTPNTIIEIDENQVETEDIAPKTTTADEIIEIKDKSEVITKKNRSNVIDSSDSDDECNVSAVNESIVVDVHNNSNKINKDLNGKIEKVVDKMMVDEDHTDVRVQNPESDTADNVKQNNADDIDVPVDDNDEIVEDNNLRKDNDAVKEGNSACGEVTNIVIDNNEDDSEISINNYVENDNTGSKKVGDKEQVDPKSVVNTDEIKAQENTENITKDKDNTDLITEDVMDVDFSDDF